LSGFDNFYGSDNFSGEISKQIIVEQQKEVVCHSQTVEIIQQRLLVLQEMAKRIITEQICEVETQTIVFEQFHSSLSHFGSDLTRHSSRNVGYDSSISGHLSNIVNSDGSLSNNDLGFNGQNVGQNTIVPSGGNWKTTRLPPPLGLPSWPPASRAVTTLRLLLTRPLINVTVNEGEWDVLYVLRYGYGDMDL
ncbi:hypothetical protein CPB84DRAFT_1678317, partial [Gymnopilus junonius]